MKKHKDAFQEEYSEFGPASVWAPDPPSENSMPIPPAARRLAKFFDLRGELSTINHVRRQRCRIRCVDSTTRSFWTFLVLAHSLTCLLCACLYAGRLRLFCWSVCRPQW